MGWLTAIRRRFADPISRLPDTADPHADATRYKVFRSNDAGINASLTKTAQPYEGVVTGWPRTGRYWSRPRWVSKASHILILPTGWAPPRKPRGRWCAAYGFPAIPAMT